MMKWSLSCRLSFEAISLPVQWPISIILVSGQASNWQEFQVALCIRGMRFLSGLLCRPTSQQKLFRKARAQKLTVPNKFRLVDDCTFILTFISLLNCFLWRGCNSNGWFGNLLQSNFLLHSREQWFIFAPSLFICKWTIFIRGSNEALVQNH